eukprot:10221097-Ditylum_brightwellii.AAC.1
MELHPRTNLPCIMIRSQHTIEETVWGLQAALDLASSSNQNLSSAWKELLQWHQCLGHISFRQIQLLAKA